MSSESDRRATIASDARIWLGGYLVALALIGLWPSPVDRGSGGLLRALEAAVPGLTYASIEFNANVLLFVPLGLLLALVFEPRRRWDAVAVALAVSALIEVLQGLALAERTASAQDVVANTLGAVGGVTLVTLVWGDGPRCAPDRHLRPTTVAQATGRQKPLP